MPGRDIIVVGASAGGVEALMKLVRELPGNLPASLFIVLHIPAESRDLLPAILNRSGVLPASHPVDGAKFEQGHIYIAPPDHHLLIEQDHMRVVRGPKENRHRPAIDPLFRSAARAYGPRVIGVILTGSLDDGTAGLQTIKRQGGTAIIQDPKEALYPSMPQSALEHISVDYCLPLSGIAAQLRRLVGGQVAQEELPLVPAGMEEEVKIAAMETNPTNYQEQLGQPSVFSCPECGGVLWEIQDREIVRFRCRTGHAFSSESVLAEQSEALERALWVALKILDEKADLSRNLARRAREHGRAWLAHSIEARVQEAEHHATLLRTILEQSTPPDQEYTAD